MEEMTNPQELLRYEREKHGWTQAALAEVLDVDPTTVSRWERGEATPRPLERAAITRHLGIPIEVWINQPGSINKEQFDRPLHEDEQPYPPIWTIPFKVPRFIGRQDILQRLHDALLTGKTTALTQAISGLGGIGKTVTAIKYATMYRSEYQAVFWIEAESQEKLREGLIKIAHHLNLPEKRLKDPERVLAAVHRWMREHPYWLLILDNVEKVALVHQLLPSTRRGHVLITTRTQVTSTAIVNIELTDLPSEEGALLLLREAGLLTETAGLEEATEQQQDLAKQLSFLMDGLPLALEQAGAYIKEQGCSLPQYLEWYQIRQAYLLSWRRPQPIDDVYAYPYSVATTWSLSFEKIRQNSPAAVDLLSVYAFVDPEAIPDDLIITAASELGPNLEQLSDIPALLEIIAQLRRYSFVRHDAEQRMVRIHRLVQAVFKDNMDEETKETWAKRTVRAMHKIYITLSERSLQEQDLYFPHAQRCADLIEQRSFRFAEAGHFLLRLGGYAQHRVFYTEAEQYLKQAVAILEKIRAPSHPERAVAYNNMATFYLEMGKYDLAEADFHKAVAILEKNTLPEGKVLLAQALHNLADAQDKQNKFIEAEVHARQAVEIILQSEQASRRNIIYCFNTLEGILRRRGKEAEASKLSQQIEMISQNTGSLNDLDRARLLEKQAELDMRHTPRIDLVEQALALYRTVHGPEHPDIAHCLSILGLAYIEKNDYLRAKSYYQQSLDMYTKAKGWEHDDLVLILMHLGICCSALEQRKEAHAFFQKAQKIDEKHPSPYLSTQEREILNEAVKSFPPDEENRRS